MMKSRFYWIVVALVVASAADAIAAPVNVVNPSFEDISGEAPFNEFTFGPLNGWGLYDPLNVTGGGAGNVYYIGTLTPFEPDPIGAPGVYANFDDGAADGQRVGIAFNFFGSGNQGEYGFQQTLSETLRPNTQYVLEVEVGNIASATARNGDFFDLDGLPGYRIDLLAGGIPIAQDNNTLFGAIEEGEFGTSTITFTTGPSHVRLGQQLGIRLVNLNQIDPAAPDSDLEVDFDHVRLDASPAPDGDYNQDGVTDAADYVVWQRLNGSLPAYYDVWQLNFDGATDGSGGEVTGDRAVPEPQSILFLALGAMLSAFAYRRT